MKILNRMFVMGFIIMVGFAPAVFANEMVVEKQQVDGYTVTLHVMRAEPGKEMGGSHDVYLQVEKDGKPVTDIVANSKVIHPDGKAQSKMLMKMGGQLMAGYDLGHSGKHELLVLFKTADGAKHRVGMWYEAP